MTVYTGDSHIPATAPNRHARHTSLGGHTCSLTPSCARPGEAKQSRKPERAT